MPEINDILQVLCKKLFGSELFSFEYNNIFKVFAPLIDSALKFGKRDLTNTGSGVQTYVYS